MFSVCVGGVLLDLGCTCFVQFGGGEGVREVDVDCCGVLAAMFGGEDGEGDEVLD